MRPQVDALHSHGRQRKRRALDRDRRAGEAHHRAVLFFVGLQVEHLHPGAANGRQDGIDDRLAAALAEVGNTFDDLAHVSTADYIMSKDQPNRKGSSGRPPV